jgi:hypothetical protein
MHAVDLIKDENGLAKDLVKDLIASDVVVPDSLLQEDGFLLLQENGDKLLLESS